MIQVLDTISYIYIIVCVLIVTLLLILCIHKIRINNQENARNEFLGIYNSDNRASIRTEINNRKFTRKLENDIKELIQIKRNDPNISLNDARLQLLNNDTNYTEYLLNSNEIKNSYDVV
tara:strand:+ start:4608 stop:4964 length:357 start_codon:yes stop_codon:yes gene_type:complete